MGARDAKSSTTQAGSPRGPLLRRAGWNLFDQALSALTNVATAILVTHAAGAKAFDAFSVVFLLFATMIGIERALVGQPLGIRHSAELGPARRRTVSRAMGLVVTVTVPAALLMLLSGLALGGRIGSTLVATAAVLPFLILQDACRYAFFAAGEARNAALNDAVWAAVQFTAMGVLITDRSATAASLVLAWGGAAGTCVVIALLQLRAVPNPLAAIGWIKEHRDLVPYLLGEYLLSTGAFNGGYLTVGAIIGDEAVGSIRAAQVLLGPLQIVSTAGLTFGLPELSRRAERLSRRGRLRIAVLTSALMASLSLAYTGALALIPDALGALLFQAKWYEAQAVLLPLSLAMVMSTSALGPSMILYALGHARRTYRLMTVEAPLVFTLMISGTLLQDVRGAAWGQFIDQAAIILLWYATLWRALAASPAEPRPAPEPASEPARPASDQLRDTTAAPGPAQSLVASPRPS